MIEANKNPKSYLTISVDDGHPSDFKAAEILEALQLEATFYIPKQNPEREVITESRIRDLSKHFEIGGHALNHIALDKMNQNEAWDEIEGGKKWLDDCLGKETVAFCYPQGRFNSATAHLVEKAGFLGARNCYLNMVDFPKNPYQWGVSTQGYSHSRAIQLRHALIEGNFRGAKNFVTIFNGNTDWENHFTSALDWTERHGGIAHLYFHSWEIDQMNQWDKLKRVLENASKRSSLQRVTNGDLFRAWQWH